jgi:anti-sigma B factor antagonist
MGLEVSAERQEARSVVRLVGELDIASVPQVEAVLRRAEEDVKPLVLDLSRLNFIDSSGLRLVLGADARARQAGVSLTIVRGPEPVRRVFRIAHLDDRLSFVDDLDEAGPPE